MECACIIALDTWIANPLLPDDIVRKSYLEILDDLNIFLSILKILVQYLKIHLRTENVEMEGLVPFVANVNKQAGIDHKMLKFFYDRLHSLLVTL